MRLTYVFLLFLAVADLAEANTVILTPVTAPPLYQQTTNNPCVIGESSCKQPAGFAETDLPAGSTSSYDALSPVYTVGQIEAIVGDSFMIGVDINQANEVQTLSLFEMLINGSVVDTYSSTPAFAVPPTTGGGNGNGWADYTLNNFASLASYSSTATVQFHVVMPLVNDGAEQYFLISNGGGGGTLGDTPEPLSLFLMGGGLLGVGILGKFRRA